MSFSFSGGSYIISSSIGALSTASINFGISTPVNLVKVSNGVNPLDNPFVGYPLAPVFAPNMATSTFSYSCGGVPQPFRLLWIPTPGVGGATSDGTLIIY